MSIYKACVLCGKMIVSIFDECDFHQANSSKKENEDGEDYRQGTPRLVT